MDLILSHNCTVLVWPDMIRVTSPGVPRSTPATKRGAVKTFSDASRKRLFEFMHQIEFYRLTFITLTYPKVFPTDGKDVKKHLRRFRARLERKYGKLRVLWRLEYQRRGAPHFHLLVMDAPFIDKKWLSSSWYDCVGSEDPKHLIYGTRIEAVAKKGEDGKIFAYVGKYLGKTDQSVRSDSDVWSGRYWGKWNVQTALPIEIEVDFGQAVRAVAVAVSTRGNHKAFTPRNVLACRVFGGGVGSDGLSRAVIRAIKEKREQQRTRELDSRSGIVVE